MMEFSYMIHMGIIATAILLGSLIRSKVKFFQHFLMPSSIIGGILLLFFYNYAAPRFGLTTDFLGELMYHLLNISFIAMMLRPDDGNTNKITGRRLAQNVVSGVAQYGIQVTAGLIVTILLIATVCPDLFPAFGLTLPLGFEQGPGQAYSIASPWEAMGFEGASSVALAIAAIGFFVGSVGGVILINIGIRRGWVRPEIAAKIKSKGVQTGFLSRKEQKEGTRNTTDSESIDSLSYHIALILFTYLLSYGFLKALEFFLLKAGPLGAELMTSFWGINFTFSLFIANFVKFVMKKLGISYTVDSGTMNRINGLAVDALVVSSLGAISIASIASYWLPITVLSAVGVLVTCFLIPWYSSRLFDDYQFPRMLLILGAASGTLPTGLSLLRVVDPDFETPAASDFVYGSSIVFFLVIPLILTLNLPALAFVQDDPKLFWVFCGISVLYLLLTFIGYLILAGKRAFRQKHLFYRSEDLRK